MKEKLTVLIAGNLKHEGTFYRDMLEEDYQVIEAGDGAKAVEILYRKHVDIALLDLALKKMNGTEVLLRIKNDPLFAEIPVFVITVPDTKTVEKILALGADDFILKPCSPAVIRNRVANMIQKRLLENKIRQNRIEGRRPEFDRKVMAAGVSNELRYPIDAILKTAKTCQEQIDDTLQVQQAISDIRRQAKYALSLLKDISGLQACEDIKEAAGILDWEQKETVRDGVKNFSSMEALIIDDNQISCRYHAQMFSRLGISCRLTEHSEDAVELIENRGMGGAGIDICVVNWQMEHKNGAAIVQKIRSLLANNTKIVVSTNNEESQEEAQMLESGADYVLKKPLNQSTIYRLATQVCQRAVRR